LDGGEPDGLEEDSIVVRLVLRGLAA
jgi:hypothetical protein